MQNFNYARHYKFLKELKVILPNQLIASYFDKIVSSIYEQIKQLRLQNINSGKIRDLLIPQLVTGKRGIKL